MTLDDEPFSFQEGKGDVVRISHRGRMVKTLKGKEAIRFMSKVDTLDSRQTQLLMARVTGQFKFGNER